jgi:hypothetical protein
VVLCNILADFGVDFRFRKHALSENGNAKFFFGVDFFQPAKGIMWFFRGQPTESQPFAEPSQNSRIFGQKFSRGKFSKYEGH